VALTVPEAVTETHGHAGCPKPRTFRCPDAGTTAVGDHAVVANRVMFVQVKTGYGTDLGPPWMSYVQFNKTWKTAYWHGKALRRRTGRFDANFYDTETEEKYWLSGTHGDRPDSRYSNLEPTIDEDVPEAYEAFLAGAPLPGRERG
jgi:hypothetical protein